MTVARPCVVIRKTKRWKEKNHPSLFGTGKIHCVCTVHQSVFLCMRRIRFFFLRRKFFCPPCVVYCMCGCQEVPPAQLFLSLERTHAARKSSFPSPSCLCQNPTFYASPRAQKLGCMRQTGGGHSDCLNRSGCGPGPDVWILPSTLSKRRDKESF